MTTATPYPPGLSDAESNDLASTASDWAISNGLAVRPVASLVDAQLDAIAAVHVPVTLFPSPFPRESFEQARSVQKAYNRLYAAVSRDERFMSQIVKDVGDSDAFIGNLWKVHLRVKKEGYTQPLSLGLFRSDYMVHRDASARNARNQVKQVEFNTIAASFGGLSSQTSRLHRYLSRTHYPLLQNAITAAQLDLPPNDATRSLAAGIVAAFDAYGTSDLGHGRCVIFLVQGGERNMFDQRHLEYSVRQQRQDSAIPVFRLPFADVADRTTTASTPKRQLLYRSPTDPSRTFEAAVVYFRSGYGPADYPDDAAWEARYHVERSGAIKCPTVLSQLSGAKKVQQVLATPAPASSDSILNRFIGEDTDAGRRLRETFANIYPMDASQAGLGARRCALDPELCKSYVLKPQREGGGNNIYKGAIPNFLESLPEAHWASFILMELITPPPVQNLILRNGRLEHGGVICELGVYGTCLWDQNTGEVVRNEEAGYLLRTKGDQIAEGGVAAGFGCMDSVCLV